MEPVTGSVLGTLLGALAEFSEPTDARYEIYKEAPAEHRPLGFSTSSASYDVHPREIKEAAITHQYGQPGLSLSFSSEFAAWLATATAENIGAPMPMSLCGEEVMAPIIREAITGGKVMISGQFEMAELNAIAMVLSGQFDCHGQPMPGYVPASAATRSGSRGN